MSKTVKHQSIELGWIEPNEIINPKTLVLGSFNPYESKTKSVDYYYGRTKNHFWRTIANIIKKDEEYFFDKLNGFKRKKEIMQNRFCCLDVIDSIDFKAENDSTLDNYLKNEIFSNYLDQKIWSSKTKYKKQDSIQIIRKYNQSIIDFLNKSNSIEIVIHTMGVNRISKDSANPKEAKLMDSGFNGFIKKIKTICEQKNIDFVLDSYSPSDYAVKTVKTKKDDLNHWLKTNLWLGE
jgi:G:T/U-mismatch repair DNA glycosylase